MNFTLGREETKESLFISDGILQPKAWPVGWQCRLSVPPDAGFRERVCCSVRRHLEGSAPGEYDGFCLGILGNEQ